MSDIKSKLPDMKELASMGSKLFHAIKTSVGEIIHDYKEVRAQPEVNAGAAEEVKKAEKPKPAEEVKTEEEPKK